MRAGRPRPGGLLRPCFLCARCWPLSFRRPRGARGRRQSIILLCLPGAPLARSTGAAGSYFACIATLCFIIYDRDSVRVSSDTLPFDGSSVGNPRVLLLAPAWAILLLPLIDHWYVCDLGLRRCLGVCSPFLGRGFISLARALLAPRVCPFPAPQLALCAFARDLCDSLCAARLFGFPYRRWLCGLGRAMGGSRCTACLGFFTLVMRAGSARDYVSVETPRAVVFEFCRSARRAPGAHSFSSLAGGS